MLFDIYEQLMITKTLVSLITGPKMYCSVTQTQSLYRGFPYIRFPYIRTLIHYSLIGAFGASKFGALSRGSLITEVCISGSNCSTNIFLFFRSTSWLIGLLSAHYRPIHKKRYTQLQATGMTKISRGGYFRKIFGQGGGVFFRKFPILTGSRVF